MNDDMTRAPSTLGGGGLEARAKPPFFLLASMLRHALQGAVFPLSVRQLVRVARENDAPRDVLTLLGGLPCVEFRSLKAVEFALEGDAQDRGRAERAPASER
jgi:hypothetical protein